MLKRGFKVLRNRWLTGLRTGYHITSCTDKLEYPPYTWVMPELYFGPLCVFDRKETAEAFCKDMSNWNDLYFTYMVAPCLYVPSRHDHVWSSRNEWFSVHISNLPLGTQLAAMVKCIY